MVAAVDVGCAVRGQGGEVMRVRVRFPMVRSPEGYPAEARQNHKAVRENLLLDTTDSGVEKALVGAAQAAAGPGQEVFVSRGYGPSGRLSVWIVDQRATERRRSGSGEHQRSGTGTKRERAQALRAALARIQI